MYTRVRLAWYYRPSDVSDRPVADSRLLLAAIYSEICDIAQLRAKCYVVHRDKITDLAGWKKRPDRFYFNRLFDPYIKKEFEVIQSNDVRNRTCSSVMAESKDADRMTASAVPTHIRDELTSRYEYVVAEKEIVPDLTDTLRNCDTCSSWCSPYVSYSSTHHFLNPSSVSFLMKTRNRPMRPLQVILPHGLRATAAERQAHPWLWLDMWTMLARARESCGRP